LTGLTFSVLHMFVSATAFEKTSVAKLSILSGKTFLKRVFKTDISFWSFFDVVKNVFIYFLVL